MPRDAAHAIVIVSMRVPNLALESIPAEKKFMLFWPCSEGKELVWMGQAKKRLPLYLYNPRGAVTALIDLRGTNKDCLQHHEDHAKSERQS